MSARKFNNRNTGENWFVGGVVAIWVVSLLASLGVTAVIIWGVIKLVEWVTAQ